MIVAPAALKLVLPVPVANEELRKHSWTAGLALSLLTQVPPSHGAHAAGKRSISTAKGETVRAE